jgi:hypothetical protein
MVDCYPHLKDVMSSVDLGHAYHEAARSTYYGIPLSELTREELLVVLWHVHKDHRLEIDQEMDTAGFVGYCEGILDGIRRDRY